MAIPRPILIALLGLVLVAAAFVATRGAGSSGNVAPTATPITPAPVKKAPARSAVATHTGAKHQPQRPRAGHKVHTPAAAAKPAAPAPQTAAQAEQAKLQRAITAVNRGDVVLFFFSRPGAADDAATRAAIQSLGAMKGVTVVSAGLDELALYRPVLQSAGVTQVPAVVITHGRSGARVLQGYVDANTLRQNVADARR